QRLTNWESDTLTAGQMTYAATDSWISLLLWKAVVEQGVTDSAYLAELRANGLKAPHPTDNEQEKDRDIE
ncbi:hypothetical protein NP234_24545, partial [Salmonella enterica]|nr:hypothetical protein [Salmonella enterica]